MHTDAVPLYVDVAYPWTDNDPATSIDALQLDPEVPVETKFRFIPLRVTEDYDAVTPGIDVENIGEIQVRLGRCVKDESAGDVLPTVETPSMPALKPEDRDMSEIIELEPSVTVHEKQMKGRTLSHVVALAGERPAVMGAGMGIATPLRDLDTPERPYIAFRFLYRSKRRLALGLRGMALIRGR